MNKKLFFILIFFALILVLSNVSANEIEDTNITSTDFDSPIETVNDTVDLDKNNLNDNNNILKASPNEQTRGTNDIIVVNNWDELQYYCSLNDKNYVLKLKENTNFYPTDPSNPNYQIKIKNNVKIIGSEGSYFGDTSSNPTQIEYVAIIVENDVRKSLTLDNITFKWIYSYFQPDAIFIQMGGKLTNVIKNCYFHDINANWGHATIVHLKKGQAIIDNCSFVNCTSGYGVIGIYDPNSVKSTNMTVRNCYFENNYARTEPGCINNCGKLTVYNTTFFKNRSYWWAGAIHTHGGGNTTIYNSNFTDNVAGWNGGALYTYGYLQIYNSTFVGNNCTTNSGGGAIGACKYISEPHIYIENSLFKKNANNCWSTDPLSNDLGFGGAIALMDAGSLTVLNTTFIANSAAYGTAISAFDVELYGSPDIIIVNNSFINHTKHGDVLNVRVKNTILNISNNYYYGNSIVFSTLNLTKLSEGKEQATLQINISLATPNRYDKDILNKTLFDVYMNNKYVKTVNSTIFTVDFGDYDICNVYVIPTISNRLSNNVTIVSTRDYIFVSKTLGNDNNNGLSRDTPVSTIKKALELASNCQNIILLDGNYSEDNINIDYEVTIKGEGNATLTNSTSFIVNTNKFTLKNMNINNLNVNTFINQANGNLVVNNCIFKDNHADKIVNGKHSDISKSIFINNDGVLIYNNGFASIKNSILLNNSKIIEGNTNNISLDYNWWGNALPDLNINNHITLNATASAYALENNHASTIYFAFYLNNSTKYNNLPEIILNILTLNGTSDKNTTYVNSNVIYTLTAFGDGVLIAEYNGFKTNVSFEFLKSNPNISLTTNDIMYGDDLSVQIHLPKDVTGNITVTVGDISQNKVINSSIVLFTFSNLKANTYNVVVSYSGDKKYVSEEVSSSVKVKRYESTTTLNISAIEVEEDINLTITTTNSATGNITLSINGNEQILILNNSSANYTMVKVPRGDYLIKAVYNGDDKYFPSQVSRLIEVDNLNATMNINAENITYGDVAIINIVLNNDATGNVTVSIDGVSNTSSVVGGIAQVLIYGLEAGVNKNIDVFYTGDNTYFNLTKSNTFTINKADLTFNITSINVKIGQNAEIIIKVPPKIKGNFTIDGKVINIPYSGEITYIIPDLAIGDYEYVAIYNGNNYNTVSKSTSFSVLEYPTPQWAGEGGNPQNNGQSSHESTTNGEVAFVIPINDTIIGDLAIDSEGNLYVVTASKIYSFNRTTELWCYSNNYVIGNFSGVAIGRDVIITPKSGDTLYFINQSSGEKYGNSNIYQGSSLFAPIIDSNANLYIVSEYQTGSNDYKLVIVPYKMWENGGEPTLISIGNSKPLASPTVSNEIIVVLAENRFTIINAKTLKINAIKSGNFMNVRPVISNDNIVYCVLGDSIVAFKSSGAQLWKTKVTKGVGNHLVLDNEHGLYHVNSKGTLYNYNLTTGKESKISDLKITSGILIGSDGTLYFASNKVFYAMNSNGNILYKSYLGYNLTGNPIMDKNGLIYITSSDNKVIALTYANLKDSKLNVSVNIAQGNNAILSITLDNQTTGNVLFTLNGVNYNEVIIDGKITKVISNLRPGIYKLNVTYSGDMRFNQKTVPVRFVVRSAVDIGDLIKFDGNSTFSLDLANASGNLSVTINNHTYNSKLINGHASIVVKNLVPNSYQVFVSYSGDEIYNSSSKMITVIVPKIILSANDLTIFYSSDAEFKVRLTQGSMPLIGKKIIIYINKKPYNAVTDRNGYASIKLSLVPKVYAVVVSYGSIRIAKKITVKSVIYAKNLNVKKSAKSIKIRISLKKVNNKYLKYKKITLKFNKKTFKVKTNKKGLATFTIKKSIYKKLKTGKKYTYQVIYKKDQVKKTIKINK